MTGDAQTIKLMQLRRDGVCGCGTTVVAGTRAGWDRVRRQVVCPGCLNASAPERESPALVPEPRLVDVDPPPSAEAGRAGGSAQSEYERRKARRQAQVRAAHPRLGGFLLSVTNEPQSTRAWASGAEGERRVAVRLAEMAGDDVLLLHDRRIPGSRANIDHLAIGAAGVYVIDAKRYRNADISVRRSGGLFRPVVEQLFVGGRDRTKLVTGLTPQVAAVRKALADFVGDTVPVTAMLCFVDGRLPIFGSLSMAGVPIVGPKGAAKLIRAGGPFGTAAREAVRAHLASRLPAM
jgi:hypothetical protein